MDGAILNFNENDYAQIINANLTHLGEFNSTSAAEDFEFNAALVYYDSYDVSSPDTKATNLFGILILDDFTTAGNISYLKKYKKNKPNSITKLNGNSYSLKLDIKFDASIGNAGVETIINDYNTISMDLFIDATNQLQKSGDMFMTTELDVINIKDRLKVLENFYFSQQELSYINTKLNNLEAVVQNAKIALASPTVIFDLISNINKDISSIINGKISTNLTYNTDVFESDFGIFIDKSVPGKVKLNANRQYVDSFAICKNENGILNFGLNNGTYNGTWNNVIILDPFTNYYKHKSITSNDNLICDLIINIEDLDKWKTGQILKLVFDKPIITDIYSIIINTDYNNIFKEGVFKKQICTLSTNDLFSNKPIIEIMCIDENTYNFNIDIIR